MATVRKLTQAGVAQFRQHLELLAAGQTLPSPVDLLTDEQTSEALTGHADIESRAFASKMEVAQYLNAQLAALDRHEVDHDVGVWSWITLFYFDQVCPPRGDGRRDPRQIERHIPSQHAWTYYRHLLAGPYRLLRLHDANARLFLHGPLHIHGDFSEQLASRMELITNRQLIEAVDRLYFAPDANGGTPKRGAATRTRPGNLRRLIAVIQQLDLTYDLYAMTSAHILRILPDEFDQWRGTGGTGHRGRRRR